MNESSKHALNLGANGSQRMVAPGFSEMPGSPAIAIPGQARNDSSHRTACSGGALHPRHSRWTILPEKSLLFVTTVEVELVGLWFMWVLAMD